MVSGLTPHARHWWCNPCVCMMGKKHLKLQVPSLESKKTRFSPFKWRELKQRLSDGAREEARAAYVAESWSSKIISRIFKYVSRWQQIFALPEENVLTCWESAPVCGRILKPLKCDLCYDLRLRLRAQEGHVEWRVGAPWWSKAAAHIILKLESVLLLEREKAESWVVESQWSSDSGKGENF